ncbi:MAG: hypothetical protein WCO22_18095 [Betaproteobacteria bacterium]
MPLIRYAFATLCFASAAIAQASDWQYAGYSKIGQDEYFLFYDAEGVQRPSTTVARYWLKAMTRASVDLYSTKHAKVVVEKTAQKVAVGYVPSFYKLAPIRAQYASPDALLDAVIEISGYEVVANERDALVKNKLYFELDCRERKSKLLEMITYDTKGNLLRKGGSAQNRYEFIPPDSNGEWQSQLICALR